MNFIIYEICYYIYDFNISYPNFKKYNKKTKRYYDAQTKQFQNLRPTF